MPYRIHLADAGSADLDRLVDLGALDVESSSERGLAALMPDGVTPEQVAHALGRDDITVSPAIPRDDGSVWMLSPRPFEIGRLRIVPAGTTADAGALQLLDTAAFGTGLHPTTALCLELLGDIVDTDPPAGVLDVGTGSGILALAAVTMGVSHATAIDVDRDALAAAAANARLNGLSDRLVFVHGGPEAVTDTWPLVLANILAAPLMEMAPALIRRVGHHGRLMLSGIPQSLEADVLRVYKRAGMHHVRTTSRSGWTAILAHASW